jgi:DNA-binding LytR/AlgR family response regulator
MPQLQLVAKCSNAFEANDALQQHDIDLIFLDIQMPQLTGTDFLKSLHNPPAVIFTTAYPEYALEGFELNAVDYLLKPIAPDRFMKAVNKAIEQIELRRGTSAETETDHFFVKSDKKMIRVNIDDVLYIEGLKDYVMIHLTTGRIIALQTMKSLEDKLPARDFVRIHRSYIVSISKIKAVEAAGLEILEKGQVKLLPVGKNHRDQLMELIEKNKL